MIRAPHIRCTYWPTLPHRRFHDVDEKGRKHLLQFPLQEGTASQDRDLPDLGRGYALRTSN